MKNMTEAKDIYESFAWEHTRHCEEGKGKVFIKECNLCGFVDWSSTHSNEPYEVVVTQMDELCPHCVEATQRAPEIMRWVLNVVSKSQRDMKLMFEQINSNSGGTNV